MRVFATTTVLLRRRSPTCCGEVWSALAFSPQEVVAGRRLGPYPGGGTGKSGLENGDRRLTLDEAFALAQVLEAVPAPLLSRPKIERCTCSPRTPAATTGR